MNDILYRLRHPKTDIIYAEDAHVMRLAASEIERLRAACAAARREALTEAANAVMKYGTAGAAEVVLAMRDKEPT